MIFALLMLMQSNSAPAPNDATGRLFDCMYGNTDKFEPSNESPQTIAIAVISACSREIDAEVRYATLQQSGGRQTVENSCAIMSLLAWSKLARSAIRRLLV
jgi:hypothetical protein